MTILDTIWETVVEEFSDLGDPAELTRLVLRLLVAAVLGGILGWERESQGKSAGVRTHMLVCSSAAVVVVVSLQSGMTAEALSRVLQGLLAGIGFLCAGVILKLEREERVQGLTTAAGVWMTSAIGIAAGLGQEMSAALCTLLVLGILLAEQPLRRLGSGKRPAHDD